MSIRDLETRLTGLEDNILDRFGYREFSVVVDGTTLNPPPEVISKGFQDYSEAAISKFINSLGGKGNPTGFFEVTVSRLISETLIRSYKYWTITRDSYVADCLPVAIKVTDSRIIVTLAVIKVAS
jgi:hypothetical protein